MATVAANCQECGQQFQARKRKGVPENRFCSKRCSNRHTARNRASTTYRRVNARGYVELWRPDHPMAHKSGYVLEHRLVIAEHIGRLLWPDEVVHHRNENTTDNRVENLDLLTKRAHDRLPKPLPKPFPCPHCGGLVQTFGTFARVRKAVAIPPAA